MKIIVVLLQVCGCSTLLPYLSAIGEVTSLFNTSNNTINIPSYIVFIALLFYPFLTGFLYLYTWKIKDLRLSILLSAIPIALIIPILAYLGVLESSLGLMYFSIFGFPKGVSTAI